MQSCPTALSSFKAVAAACAVLCFSSAAGQSLEAAPTSNASPLKITPLLSASVLYSNNGALLTRTGGTALTGAPDTAEVVTTLSPGLNLSASSRTLQANLSYLATGFFYKENEEANRVGHTLRGAARWEPIDDLAFVDFTASRSEQAQSAFAPGIAQPIQVNANRVEVTNLTLSPALRSRLAGTVDAEARYTVAVSESSRGLSTTGGGSALPGLGRLLTNSLAASLSGGSRLRWSLQAEDSTRSANLGRDIENRRALATLGYSPDVDWQLRASVGFEETNTLVVAGQRYQNTSAGFTWAPSPRTNLSAEVSERFFGTSHTVALTHQFARVSLRVSDSRSVASQLGLGAGSTASSTLLDELRRSSSTPPAGSAAERDQLILQALQAAGLNPNLALVPGSLNTTPSTLRRQEVQLAFRGLRLAGSVNVFASQQQRLGSPLNPFEDLALTPRINQRGAAAQLGWRLTQDTNLSAVAQTTRSESVGALAGVDQSVMSLALATRLGRHANLTLTAQDFKGKSSALGASQARNGRAVGATVSFTF